MKAGQQTGRGKREQLTNFLPPSSVVEPLQFDLAPANKETCKGTASASDSAQILLLPFVQKFLLEMSKYRRLLDIKIRFHPIPEISSCATWITGSHCSHHCPEDTQFTVCLGCEHGLTSGRDRRVPSARREHRRQRGAPPAD